jgi:hypothetical protein
MTKTIEQRAKEIGDAPAFPFVGDTDYMGMTYRQWLVGQAMNGLMSGNQVVDGDQDWIATNCIKFVQSQLIALAEMEAKNG